MNSVFFDVEYSTERLVKESGKSYYIPNSEGIGNMRQMSEDMTALNGMQWGELWEMYAEHDADIIVSDKIICDDGTFLVKGVRSDRFGGIEFKKLSLMKDKV